MNFVHLYINKEVLVSNNRNTLKVGNLIALVESKNTNSMKLISKDNFSYVSSSVYLHMGMKITLIRNYLNAGLSNRSIRIIKEKEIACKPRKIPPPPSS